MSKIVQQITFSNSPQFTLLVTISPLSHAVAAAAAAEAETTPEMASQNIANGPDPESVLHLSEYFLRDRNYSDCKMYALHAQQSGSNLPGVSQIIAVADVLLASKTRRDHYSILNLKPFCSDPNVINESFENLTSLLNPSSNPYPFADEAFELVQKAFSVLSDPLKKTQFDSLLKSGNVNGNAEKLDGFWTVCPYCYYVYEYAKVYEGCNLRCPNEKCAKGFRGLMINPPPVDVLIKGEYSRPWTPFMPMRTDVKEGGTDDEISDDDCGKLGGGDKFDESSKGMDSLEVNKQSVLKKVLKRTKKSVGWNTTKVMGTGNRVKRQAGVPHSASLFGCGRNKASESG